MLLNIVILRIHKGVDFFALFCYEYEQNERENIWTLNIFLERMVPYVREDC